jgi:hypothetical protein
MKVPLPENLRAHERLLVLIERSPWRELYRIAIGYAMMPLFFWWFGTHENDWAIFVWFSGVLVSIRVVPMVLRKVLLSQSGVHVVWAEQRRMAKRFDSYQWQKLLWIGIGLMVYSLVSGRFSGVVGAVVILSLISGGLGLVVWRQRAAVWCSRQSFITNRTGN